MRTYTTFSRQPFKQKMGEGRVSSKASREVFQPGEIVGSYEIIRLIGQGGYGDIYHVVDKSSSEENSFAMKVEYLSSPKQALRFEKQILEDLNGSQYSPHMYHFGLENKFRYLVMDLLGPSVSNTRREMPKHKYSLFTALRLSFFMLQCIEDIHNHGYVHCDIKPGNFLLKKGTNKPLALIDYGLSRRYIDPNTKNPYPEREKCGFIGTTKYASLNVHSGMDTSPRDDLASWVYSTVELVNGKLPWGATQNLKKIKKFKFQIPVGKLLESLPAQFIEIYDYIKNLKYLDKPNYKLLYKLLSDAIYAQGNPNTVPFDWESFGEEKIKKFSTIKNLPTAAETELFANENVQRKDARSSNSKCCILL